MKKLCILFFLCLTLSTPARERVGKVAAVEGTALALFSDKKDRKLSRGSPVFTEETLSVAERSKVQIKFTDGSLLNLIPGSEYRVNGYSYGNKRETDKYAAEAIKGGFRHLTGNIAKNNPDGVEIETPTATIGVRGTVIEAVIGKNGELYIGCQSGLIEVSNAEGSLMIGPSAPYQFLDVSSSGAPPQGLSSPPPALQNVDFSSPSGGVPTSSAGFVETGNTIQGGC